MSDPQTIIQKIKSSSPDNFPPLAESERQELINYIKNKSYSQSEPIDIRKLNIDRNKYSYDREFIVKLYRHEDLSIKEAAYILGIKDNKFRSMKRYYKVYKNKNQYLEEL